MGLTGQRPPDGHFVVRGGRIVRFEQFVDTAKVRDAMTP